MKKVLLLVPLLITITFMSFASGKKEETKGDMFLGGIVWSNWTTELAGGNGQLPAGVVNKDFVRCKACHGWDTMSINGGYVRRSGFPEKDSRPKPTQWSNISSKLGTINVSKVNHANGREWSVENNKMPFLGQDGGLTDEQMSNVTAFLNDGPKVIDFAELDISTTPVTYTFIGSDSQKGFDLYQKNCAACHGDDGNTHEVKLIDYFRKDGKYSEGFHKMIYGADSVMTRATAGNLDGQDAANILSWIQTKADDENLSGF